MRKRLLSIVLCLCMALSLLPTAARAANTDIKVGGVTIGSGADLPAGVSFANGALTLNGAKITAFDANEKAGIFANGDLTINLVGSNEIAGVGDFGIKVSSGNLTFTGDGSLDIALTGANAVGIGTGRYLYSINTQAGATVTVSQAAYGVKAINEANPYALPLYGAGHLTVKGSINGIYAHEIRIGGAHVTAEGTAAALSVAPEFSWVDMSTVTPQTYFNMGVRAGANAASATEIQKAWANEIDYTTSKYVDIDLYNLVFGALTKGSDAVTVSADQTSSNEPAIAWLGDSLTLNVSGRRTITSAFPGLNDKFKSLKAAIYAPNAAVTIAGSGVLTAVSDVYDVVTRENGFTGYDKLTGLVFFTAGYAHMGTVSGTCDYRESLNSVGVPTTTNPGANDYSILTIPENATLEVPENKTMLLTTLESDGVTAVTVNGTLVNNGTIWLPYGTAVSNFPAWLNGLVGVNGLEFGKSSYFLRLGAEWLAYGGDKSSDALDLTNAPDVKTAYKAGGGAIVYDPTATPATLTFTDATMDVPNNADDATAITLPNLPGGVKVVFNGDNSITASANSHAYAFKCSSDVTFELKDGTTTLTTIGQYAYGISTSSSGSVTVNNSGTLTIDSQGGGMDFTISASGHTVALNGGTLAFQGEAGIAAAGITLNGVTVPAGTSLSMSESRNPPMTYGSSSTIYGEVVMPYERPYTADDFTHFTGSGTIRLRPSDKIYATNGYRMIPSSGLDLALENLDAETVWQAGSGTVTYIPATTAPVANAQLIFDGASINVTPPAGGDAIAVSLLPFVPMDVIFKGRNEINATTNSGNASTFSASGNTTFRAEPGSTTTLNATGSNSAAIRSYGGDVTLTGSGELRLAPTMSGTAIDKTQGYAIRAEAQTEYQTVTVAIEGGITVYEPRLSTDSTTAAKSGVGGILANAVQLNAVTIPEGGTLDLHSAGTYGTGAVVNNGTLILPNGTTVDDLEGRNIAGRGVVKIGDVYYKNVGGTWMTDITYTGLDLVNNPPAGETTYAAGEGTVTYIPGANGGDPTLTLNSATIAPLVKADNTVVPPLTLGSAKLVLVGDSDLKGTGVPALCGYNSANLASAGNITIGGSGSLRLGGKSESLGSFGANRLTLEDTATVTSLGGTVADVVTVGPNAKLNAILKVNGNQTVYGTNTIAEGLTQSYIHENLTWMPGAHLAVNGTLTLTLGTNFADVKDKLSGDGLVRIVTAMEQTTVTAWDAYRADGMAMHAYPQGLDFTLPAGDETGAGHWSADATLTDDGYTITGSAEDGYVVMLENLDLAAALSLPNDGKVEVRLAGDSRVDNYGAAMRFTRLVASRPCTISGSGSLRLTSGSDSALEAMQPLTISGGTLRIATASALSPAIWAAGGLTLSGVRVTSPSGAVVGNYAAAITRCDTVLVGGKPAASVSLAPEDGSAPTVKVPASSDEGSVQLEAKVSGDTAELIVTDEQLKALVAGGKHTGLVKLDLSKLPVDKAVLPAKLVDAVAGSAGSTGLAVVFSTGSVTLDAAALLRVGGKRLTVSVERLLPSALTAAQRAFLGALAESAVLVDVNVLANGVRTSEFGGGVLTVSVPYPPKAGEDPSKLVVWYVKDDGTIEPMSGSYNAETKCYEFATAHLSVYALTAFPFADVKPGSYYYGAVAWALGNGVTGGKTAEAFAPGDACTRAQVVTFLWRALGSPEPAAKACGFTDVQADAYYYKAVLWAVETGVVKGVTDSAFAPEDTVTRAQAAAFLWRASGRPAAAGNPFADVAADAYYDDAVRWAAGEKIAAGTTATTFSPAAPCARAQIVSFLYRLSSR